MRFLRRLMSGLVGLISPSFLLSPDEQAAEQKPERATGQAQTQERTAPVASHAGLSRSPAKEARPVFVEATKAPEKDRNFVHYMGTLDKAQFEVDGHAVRPEKIQRFEATTGTCERIIINSDDTDYVFWNGPAEREKEILGDRKNNKVIDLGDRNGATINVKAPLDTPAPSPVPFNFAPAPETSFIHYVGQFDEDTIDINGTPASPAQISRFPEKNGICDRFKITTPDGVAHVFWNNPSAGLDGMAPRLEPPPATDAPYAAGAALLPATLAEALDALAASSVLRQGLGEPMAQVFHAIKRQELARHAQAEDAALWERREYFGRS